MTDEQTTCCGKGGDSWAKNGDPLKAGCMLCPESPTYWRTAGREKPYEPVSLDESYRSLQD